MLAPQERKNFKYSTKRHREFAELVGQVLEALDHGFAHPRRFAMPSAAIPGCSSDSCFLRTRSVIEPNWNRSRS
jgi:hypothetical protein